MTPRANAHAPMRVGVLGYLAVLERVALPVTREGVNAGSTGTRLPATLTADAPLVALALASMAEALASNTETNHNTVPWLVDACLNHPGDSVAALASRDVLASRTSRLLVGPNRGNPLEWQVLHADGEITWFSDPHCAVESLRDMPSVNWAQQGWDHLYLDGYPWLTDAISRHLPIAVNHVWLNLGVVPLASIENHVRSWREAVTGQLHVQISTAGKARLEQAHEWAELALRSGADMAIITCAEHGLVLGTTTEVVSQAALPVEHWADASGAGAAVSGALIAASMQAQRKGCHANQDLRHMAMLAVQAGRQQCMQNGALDTHSQQLWMQSLEAPH